MRGAEAEINLSALQHNLVRTRQLVGDRRIVAMIKSDAYGHGALRTAHALSLADAFGVASLDEAVSLRQSGISQPLIVMSQCSQGRELKLANKFDISIVVHHQSQLELLESTPLPQPIKVWLKVDTGMHRLGFAPDKVKSIWSRLSQLSWVANEIVMMSHLAYADQCDDPATLSQGQCFEQAVVDLPGKRSLCNSAAILNYPTIMQDWVRPGIMLYGVSPFSHRQASEFNLQPAMTLSSQLIATQSLKAGDRIGYGGEWSCPEDMQVGVVEIGYGDGYPRHAVNGTPVLVNDIVCPLVGRVSMDLLAVDLRPCPQAHVGNKVVLWGKGLPVEKIAHCAGTIAYELLCRVTNRVRFTEVV